MSALPIRSAFAEQSTDEKYCQAIVAVIATAARPPTHEDEYFCWPYTKKEGFVVVSVRSRHPAPAGAAPNWAGSNLVGYYAIKPQNGAIFEWDFAEDKPALSKVGACRRVRSLARPQTVCVP